jgi:hypothetical protein
VERQIDRVTGAPVANAFVIARNTSNTDILFPSLGSLSIGCFKGQPVVRFSFDFKVGASRNSALGYSFDSRPGGEVNARILRDERTVMIEDRNEVLRFVNEMMTSNSLYVRIRSLNAGRSSAEFDLAGAPTAIASAYTDCPIAPDKPAMPAAGAAS